MSAERTNTKVTLADVARESDVSPATVSLVLRDKPGASEETRQRVLETALRLGYAVKPTVQPFETTGISNIGVVMKVRPDDLMSVNQFYAPVLAGIETVCRGEEINLLYANMLVDDNNVPQEWPRLMVEDRVDGLMLVGERLDQRTLVILQQRGLPVVLVDAYALGDPFDSVTTNNQRGAYDACTYLVARGHRHIAIVGSQPDAFPSVQERRNGYRQAMAEHGLTPYFVDCPLHRNAVAQPLTQFLQANSQVTAIFGCNDEVAIAALRAAHALGKHVPSDLSVMGFDNIALSRDIQPALTTMRVDKMEMGRLAAWLLINRIQYPAAGVVKAIQQAALIERESVRQISDELVATSPVPINTRVNGQGSVALAHPITS